MGAYDNYNGRTYYQGRRSFDRDTDWNQYNNNDRRETRTNRGRSRSQEDYRRINYEEDRQRPEPRSTENEISQTNQTGRGDEESEPILNITRQ